MKINRALMNPTPLEVEKNLREKDRNEQIDNASKSSYFPGYLSKNSNRKAKTEQISFNVDTNRTKIMQFFSSLKTRLKRRNDFLELAPLWKFPAVPFALVTFVLNILLFIFGGILKFSDIPPRVPFFYNSVERRWEQLDKIVIFLFPIFLSVLFFIIIKLIITTFRRDRRLALTIAWIVAFLNILLLITVSQIYYLIT